MTDLAALAERVEQAGGPSRELDAEIKALIGHSWDFAADWGARGHDKPVAYAYTASIDAAMTLVPEGWAAIHGWDYPDRCHRAILMDEDGDVGFRGAARTPALALVAAALRAKGSHNHD